MKFLVTLLIPVSLIIHGCGNIAAADLSGQEVSNSAPEVDSSISAIDINLGKAVKLIINPKTDIATNVETGEVVRIYVDPVTKDTFDGLNGRKINHAVTKTPIGTYGVDMTKVRIEDAAK